MLFVHNAKLRCKNDIIIKFTKLQASSEKSYILQNEKKCFIYIKPHIWFYI